MQRNFQLLLSLVLVVVCGVALFQFKEKRTLLFEHEHQLELEQAHVRAVEQFHSSIEKFAAVVSGMSSFMNLSSGLPSQMELQQFVKYQLDNLSYRDSVVVSFLDTSHVFRYSFTRYEIDPGGLIGRSVMALRTKEKIAKLDQLMESSELQLFPPINLVEGWVGIPINFAVRRNGEKLGYVAPILNFKTIIQSVYDDEGSQDFAYRFLTMEGHEFSREAVFDGSEVYNKDKDEFYYRNLGLSEGDFIYSDIEAYGYTFTIGTGWKSPQTADDGFNTALMGWFVTLILLIGLMNWQIIKERRLAVKLVETNDQLERQSEAINEQNRKLHAINDAKNRFFSIIGHDLRSPLASIESLMLIINSGLKGKIKDPELLKHINQLTRTTKSTTSLLNNLIKWALSQSNDLDFKPRRIQFGELLFDVVKESRTLADDKQIDLRVNTEGPLVISGDANMLSTAVRNLVVNAIRYTQKFGKVELTAHQTESEITLSVVDNGVGMTEEERNSLFDLSAHKRRRGTGNEPDSGLGLLIVQDFVRKHGGRIEVASTPGEGSTFKVTFPKQGHNL